MCVCDDGWNVRSLLRSVIFVNGDVDLACFALLACFRALLCLHYLLRCKNPLNLE